MPDEVTPSSNLGFRDRPQWLLALVLVLIGQGGIAVKWLGGFESGSYQFNNLPVTSGEYPLRLYHAGLGAATLRENFGSTCYDPNFQAGYPKTPIFDAAARPLEPVLALCNDHTQWPMVAKWFLLGVTLAIPLVLCAVARGFQIPAMASILVALGGAVLCWMNPVLPLLMRGRFDLVILGLAILLFLGGLARYATQPGLTAWLQLALASVVGWYVHPVGWATLLPAVACYYVFNAPRHGLAWHLGSVAVLVVGVGVNLWWLGEWFGFWWMRGSQGDAFGNNMDELSKLDFSTPILQLSNWPLLVGAVIGLVLMMKKERRGAVAVLLLTVAGAIAMTRLAEWWPWLYREGAIHATAMIPAVLLLPNAYAIAQLCRKMAVLPLTVVLVSGFFALTAVHPDVAAFAGPLLPKPAALTIGWNETEAEFIHLFKQHTTREARILIEDLPGECLALLPVATDRLFLGGLDSSSNTEAAFLSLRQGLFAGRSMADITVEEQRQAMRKYNIGWVLCRTPASMLFWSRMPGVETVAVTRKQDAKLMKLPQNFSFVLSGSATIETIERSRIVLTNVVPDADGLLKLSFHYQKQLHAAPMVQETVPEKDLHDPMPFLTLKVPGNVSRVVLSWERY
jgi:uncharacterized membrane protein YeaQ/YmgE (transglycosylase-associated protein family)